MSQQESSSVRLSSGWCSKICDQIASNIPFDLIDHPIVQVIDYPILSKDRVHIFATVSDSIYCLPIVIQSNMSTRLKYKDCIRLLSGYSMFDQSNKR